MSMTNSENAVLIAAATDESLIQSAKDLNASYNRHLKRSIEDFWRMGETLSHLFQRRHLQGRWADILAEIEINTTTDNHARRLFQATTIDGLSEFKNKTHALRTFGILSTPMPKEKTPVVFPSQSHDDKPRQSIESMSRVQISAEPVGAVDGDWLARDERPEARVVPSKVRRSAEPVNVPATMGADQTPPIDGHPTTREGDDSLEVLAKLASRLEYLAGDVIGITPDHLAQIDRMLLAIDLIRSKGVVDAC